MPYTIDYVEEKGYILIRHFEEVGVPELRKARGDVRNLIESHSCYRVLVDIEEIKGFPPTLEQYEFNASHAEFLPKTIKIAVLAQPNLSADLRFPESVAVNRGINYKTFSEKTHAIQWLIGGSPDVPQQNTAQDG